MQEAEVIELRQEEDQQSATDRLTYGFDLDRRDFFKVLGGGIVVCLCARSALSQESGRRPHREHELPQAVRAWLHIGADGHVTVYTGKVEMGQNIRTSLAQQVAEELRVPVTSIQLIMGDTFLTPYDMGTFGSRTTPTMGPQLRKAAAVARETLIAMAAEQWKTDPSSLMAANGNITNPHGNESISYGDLTKGQDLVKVIADDVALESPTQWQIAGTPVPKVDGRDFVTGKHQYTSDIVRPRMVYGKILRPSAFHATLKSCDSAAAAKITGVTIIQDGNFVGVTAPTIETAESALKAIHAEWNAPPQTSEATLFQDLRKASSNPDREEAPYSTGSVEQALAAANKTLRQTYTVSYIAHTPLEPRAAVAEWRDGKLTVWTGTQRPFAVRDELAETFHISPENVRVFVPDTGSAYGGKHTGDAALEAARLAKAATKPVKLVWTREEEFTWAYFRPAGVIDIDSGVGSDGKLLAWKVDNYNSGPAALQTPYDVANQRAQFHSSDAPLRQGSYRSLAAPANHFAREVHMDELAHLLRMDPLDFRLKNLSDSRLRAVLQAAAENFGWGKQKNSPARGFGLSVGKDKGGHVATCVEIQIDERDVRVKRVTEAFECGAVVNPNGLQNQVSGAVSMGLGGALFEAIHFDNGRILNPHLADYRVPRFSDMPQINVVILDRKDLPSAGAGETPIIGIAPAIANAIFAATGVRLRSLPLVPAGLPKPADIKS
jgi:CO/xanthine dehydrogenase Mo-binding subunit